MTAKGTVFLALEDETGMVNVTLWPDTWARLRSVVRRHALLLVDGELQREGEVVNVIARSIWHSPRWPPRPVARISPAGVRQLGHAGHAPAGLMRTEHRAATVPTRRAEHPVAPRCVSGAEAQPPGRPRASEAATASSARRPSASCRRASGRRPGRCFWDCDWRRFRFGLDRARKRRYQAAAAAKNAPMIGE